MMKLLQYNSSNKSRFMKLFLVFIAEKGPECLEENKDVISNCMNTTFSDYVPKNLSNPFPTMPQFIIGPKQCRFVLHMSFTICKFLHYLNYICYREVDEFEKCVVDALEKCSEITPANVIQSMFKFIKNETMCPLEAVSTGILFNF